MKFKDIEIPVLLTLKWKRKAGVIYDLAYNLNKIVNVL